MPIKINGELQELTQEQFATIAYEVVNHCFAIHDEFGSLFDEIVYRNAVLARLQNAVSEVRIDVTYKDFKKSYFIDAVVNNGGVFEFKAVKNLNSSHRGQLLHYLLLTGIKHGKLINFGPEKVEHEFLNSSLTTADRNDFSVDLTEFQETKNFGTSEIRLFLDILHDWGTALDSNLYREALYHFLGGEDQIFQMVDIHQANKRIAKQRIPLCGTSTSIHLTTYQNDNHAFGHQLQRLLRTTQLNEAQWINVSRKKITVKTIHSTET